MSDPERLFRSEADEFERELLGSAVLDVGSDQALRRCQRVVTLSFATSFVATSAAAASPGMKLSAISAWTMAAKWGAVGALLGLGTMGSLSVLSNPAPDARAPTPSAASSAPSLPVPRSNASSAPPEAPRLLPNAPLIAPAPKPELDRARPPLAEPADVLPLPLEPRTRALEPNFDTPLRAPSGPAQEEAGSPSARSRSRLQEEVTELDTIREALAQRNGVTALQRLDAYDREFPSGGLRQEALLLRIEALLGLGRRAAALELGEDFLERVRVGPHAERVRTLVGR